MTTTAHAAAVYKLLDLYTDDARYLAKLGSRYEAVCERLAAYTEPDSCPEHRSGCPGGAH